jgi:hypothetical protein
MELTAELIFIPWPGMSLKLHAVTCPHSLVLKNMRKLMFVIWKELFIKWSETIGIKIGRLVWT